MSYKEKVILISGRYDRPNPGHFKTITDAGQKYKKVIVVVLDHKEQRFPVQYRAQVLKDILVNCKGEYEVIVNKVHFAHVEVEDIIKLPHFDYWGGGNMEVMKHMEKMKINTIWLDRPFNYDSSTERLGSAVKEMI